MFHLVFFPRQILWINCALFVLAPIALGADAAPDDGSSSIAIEWLSSRGINQPALPAPTGQNALRGDFILGGPTNGKILLVPNEPEITTLLLKTSDLLSAQPQLNFEKFDPQLDSTRGGDLKIYAVRDDDEDPAHGELLVSWELKNIPETQPSLLPDVSAKIKAWLVANGAKPALLLTLDGATARITVGGASNPTAQPKLLLRIRSYPSAHLFTVPFGWEPGVFTRVVDGHLNYGGKRLRLWGVVGHPNVDRLADMGFNAERIWDPQGKVGEGKLYSVESAKKGEFQPYTKGDGSELDTADKHFAELKSHGMFVMLAALTQTIPPDALYDDRSFIAGGDDWPQWKEAMQAKPAGNPYHYIFVDERLQKIRFQHAKNLLTHINPYTGKAYGEEENIALYEVFNENAFVFKILSGELKTWPPYFKAKLQKRWNTWLAARYTDDAGLKKAWGREDNGEALADGTVSLAPDFEDRLKYPEQRSRDYVHFMVDLENDFNQKFRTYCRSLAPPGVGVNVIPFSFDTQYRPNIPWAYANCLGDVFCFGMYYWDLKSSLEKPPASYLIDSFTVKDKPTVLYETNIGRPNPFRAEYPIKLAALASSQDWDGIFWHYWSRVDGEGGLPYLNQKIQPPMPTFYWVAVEHQTDPVMCSSMALAGRIFLGHYLPPADSPKVFKLGQNSIFSYSTFHGVNMAPVTFTQGGALQFAPDETPTQDNDVAPLVTRLKSAVAMGRCVIWDWPKGRLIIDAPDVKAYVGKTDGFFRFSDGITLGKISTPWITFVLESADGKPLVGPNASSRIYMGAVADAKNTGFAFNYDVVGGPTEQAKAVRDVGHIPVIVDKVEYSVWFPQKLDATLKSYDFALRETGSTAIRGGNEVCEMGPTPFIDLLNITSRGGHGRLPVTEATRISTDNSGAIPGPATPAPTVLKASDMAMPIPGLDWSMDYLVAHKYVENSPLVFTAFSNFDASSTPDKTLTVSDLQLPAFWNSAVDARVIFRDGRMTEVELTLKEPPPMEEIIDKFSRILGEPVEKKLDAQYGASRIFWERRGDAPDITVTESQGILKILFQPHR